MAEILNREEELAIDKSNITVDNDNAVYQFNELGFTTLHDVITLDDVDIMHDKAMSNYDELMLLIENNSIPFGVGIKEGYEEIVQRHVQRYEMPYKMNDVAFDTVLKSSQILKIVSSILGPEYIIINKSLVISLPGALVSYLASKLFQNL